MVMSPDISPYYFFLWPPDGGDTSLLFDSSRLVVTPVHFNHQISHLVVTLVFSYNISRFIVAPSVFVFLHQSRISLAVRLCGTERDMTGQERMGQTERNMTGQDGMGGDGTEQNGTSSI